jgi:hypothetical protein
VGAELVGVQWSHFSIARETEEWQYEDETEEEQGIKGQGIQGDCIEGCNKGARHQRH